MRKRSTRYRDYHPLLAKTVPNALLSLFIEQFGYGDKVVLAQAMIERILETLMDLLQPAALVKPGQMVWLAVPADGPKYAHQPMDKLPKKRVTLDLITLGDIKRFEQGVPIPEIRRQREARLIRQTRAQGAALAQSDVSLVTLVGGCTVSTDLKRYQQENGCVLPYRGVEHDMGSTCSHKVEIIRLLEQGYLESEIRRKLKIEHSLSSIERYVQPYKNAIRLLEKDFTPVEICCILGMPARLLEQYIEIIRVHHPDIIENSSHVN
jgi:hypothetical protein